MPMCNCSRLNVSSARIYVAIAVLVLTALTLVAYWMTEAFETEYILRLIIIPSASVGGFLLFMAIDIAVAKRYYLNTEHKKEDKRIIDLSESRETDYKIVEGSMIKGKNIIISRRD